MKIVKSVCGLCHQMCGIDVHVDDGRVIGISSMDEHERNTLCEKGYALPEIVHAPDRLTQPLMKTNGVFKEVSWEQALDFIARKLLDIREKYGAKALLTHSGVAFVRSYVEYVNRRFCDLYGTPNYTTGGGICYVARIISYVLTCGTFLNPDYERGLNYSKDTRCIVVWGNNPVESNVPLTGKGIFDTVKNGAKLIVVDPRATQLAKQADIHAQIRPGTDGALALGLLNVIIAEELHDKDFVREWTVGFGELSEYVKEFPPEKVEEITWVPADTIKKMARMYATNRPAAIGMYVAMEHHTNGVQAIRAIATLMAVTGNLDVPGGNQCMPGLGLSRLMTNLRYPELVADDMKHAVGVDYPMYYRQTKDTNFLPAIEQLASGKPYPIKGLIIAGSNAFLTWPNTSKFEKGCKNLDLMVVVDIFMTDTAKRADVVLPGTTFLERPEIRDYLGQGATLATLANQAIDPVGNSRQEWWIWAELGRRMGYAEHFSWQSAEELINHLLEPAPFSHEDLKHVPAGIYYIQKKYKKYLKDGFNTPSGKVEIYSGILKEHGYEPLPAFREPTESPISNPELAEIYPLMLLAAHKKRVYTHSQHRNIASLRKIVPEPLLDMHPATARQLNILEGDWVKLESPRESIQIRATLNDEVHPRIVAMMTGWSEANANYLTNDMTRDPISGFPAVRSVMCRVEKVGRKG